MAAVAHAGAAPKSVSPTIGRFKDALRRHPTAIAGAIVLLLMVLVAIFAPLLGTIDPQALSPIRRLRPISEEYWFGTDMLGRDVYSRVIYGTRVSLTVGLAVAFLATSVGLVIGLITGYMRRLDAVMMRVMDGLMSIPSVLLAIALISLTRASLENVIMAIAITEVPRVVRLVRSLVLTLREQPYVEAAIASGTRLPAILLRHILPNTMAPLLVQATYICASAMITEAILSFIGAGTPPNIPSWGNIMAEARSLIQVAPHHPAVPRPLPVADGAVGESARRRHARRARPAARAPDVAMNESAAPLLRVENLKTHFHTRDGVVRAVDGVSFDVMPGETLAVVGESGCGKSVTALSILRLLPMPPARIAAGRIEFDGRNLLDLSEPEMRKVRGNAISMIFQEPMTSLNPVLTIGRQIAEALVLHRGLSEKAALSARRRNAAQGAHPGGGTASHAVSAPALRRHAPARDDRDGARLRAAAADRRRADDRARRHDPGADPRADARAARGDRRVDDPDHARSRRGGRDRAPRRRDVRGPQGRGSADRGAVRRAAPSVHARPARVDAPPRRLGQRDRQAAGRDPRHGAVAEGARAGLPVRAALPQRRRALRGEVPPLELHAPGHWAACWHPVAAPRATRDAEMSA